MECKKLLKFLDNPRSQHPIVSEVIAGLILATCTAVGGWFIGSNNPAEERYIAIDNISTLLDTYFVDMGYVDNTVLEVGSLDKQFQIISEAFGEYDHTVRTSLIEMGNEPGKVNGMDRMELLQGLSASVKDTVHACEKKDKEIDSLKADNSKLQEEKAALSDENKAYKQRKEAELIASRLVIDGETMNNGAAINNAVAKIEGNFYYSQSFLNAHVLDKQINQDEQENVITVGQAKPEKVKFSWSVVTDSSGVDLYETGGGRTFTMDTKSYSEGLVLTGEDNFYAYLGGEYSKLSFTYGHVDKTKMHNLKLTVYALDENNESYSVLKTIPLKAEMSCNKVEIPLGYATKIKVEMSGSYDYYSRVETLYGLTDIYLYS